MSSILRSNRSHRCQQAQMSTLLCESTRRTIQRFQLHAGARWRQYQDMSGCNPHPNESCHSLHSRLRELLGWFRPACVKRHTQYQDHMCNDRCRYCHHHRFRVWNTPVAIRRTWDSCQGTRSHIPNQTVPRGKRKWCSCDRLQTPPDKHEFHSRALHPMLSRRA